MEIIVGYTVSVYDNGTDMFEHDDPKLERCPACGYRTNFFAHNSFYRQPRKRRSDLLCTYDDALIATRSFRDFCEKNEYRDVKFLEFRNDPDHFHFQAQKIVTFNAKRRGTKFIAYCPVCENYESVIGADPAYLEVEEPLADGFYRTDILFGPKNAKGPQLLVGCETKTKIEAAKLKGMIFREAYN